MQIEADHYLYLSGLAPLPFESPIPVRHQLGADLGQRMENAFRETLAQHQSVLIVGTDSPALHPSVFNDAFAALNSSDLVLGPTDDGGYYLIAVRSIISEAFHNIAWGTSEVLSQTLSAVRSRRITLLPPHYDVDHPDDLKRLARDAQNLAFAPNTVAWLKTNYAR
jgi:rSAM/selenodomain-associated transferase 1